MERTKVVKRRLVGSIGSAFFILAIQLNCHTSHLNIYDPWLRDSIGSVQAATAEPHIRRNC